MAKIFTQIKYQSHIIGLFRYAEIRLECITARYNMAENMAAPIAQKTPIKVIDDRKVCLLTDIN